MTLSAARQAYDLVSICMPAFNSENTIQAAIESVLQQSWSHWELIVVDDGSTDDTAAIVEALQDHRVRLLRHQQPSGGPAVPRNTAMQHARGRYIAFLDSDDVWLPEKLERQIEFMQSSHASLCCSGYWRVSPNGERQAILPPAQARYADILRQNTAGCLTVMLDTEQWPAARFPQCGHEDYALWLSLLRDGEVMMGLPELLAEYRQQPHSASSSSVRNVGFLWHIYYHLESLGFARSLYRVIAYAWRRQQRYQS
ncbi:teichuronic acid biosynthesis [Bacterioplanes sanyensis]|uniref:Teichuronic acid biosynthesis n=1 Tax=Bacterioplanes sanyensis TaxID=1249553 RepID=A0A222FG70_9GAMM|nr:glycosyltransferase family 2 protein [Bacterioplanes sanyensis]ASP37494.1 teichuronic acid biosynthesis [Bacterioplanes sanyensis]